MTRGSATSLQCEILGLLKCMTAPDFGPSETGLVRRSQCLEPCGKLEAARHLQRLCTTCSPLSTFPKARQTLAGKLTYSSNSTALACIPIAPDYSRKFVIYGRAKANQEPTGEPLI